MVSWVSVSQTEVQFAAVTDAGHQLLLLALGLVALVGEDLGLLPSLAVVLNVLRHGVIGDTAPAHRDGLTAQGTHGHLAITNVSLLPLIGAIIAPFYVYLNVFLVQACTAVGVVLEMIFA